MSTDYEILPDQTISDYDNVPKYVNNDNSLYMPSENDLQYSQNQCCWYGYCTSLLRVSVK